jgi:NAD+ synthase
VKLTLAQVNPTVGDLDGNMALVRRVRDHAADSDLIIFPELVLSGYPPEDLVLKPQFMADIKKCIDALVAESVGKPAILVTAPWEENHKRYNAALLIHDGTIGARIYKNRLPNYGVFDEKRTFDAGPLPAPIAFKGHNLGIMICEDMWSPEVAAHLKAQGAEILIVPNGSPFEMNKHDTRLHHARLRIEETALPLVYVNQYGGQDGLIFDGGSFALNKECETVFHAAFFKDDIATINYPFVKTVTSGWVEDHGHTYNAIKLATRDYVVKNGFDKGVLIGLSGGIDSALVAAIAVDALGADTVHCVMMPSPFTAQDSLDDARACAKALGVSYEEISIAPMMAAMEGTIDNLDGLAHENMQSRARGLILMSLSNQTGRMVLTTGNKSEMACGYATLYGDMCGGFNPLKDVYKTKVYELAHWRNKQGAVIPDRILTKAPSAELRANQTDQDSLPPYDVLDDILECLIERDMGVAEITERGHAAETVKKVWKMLDLAEYKRRQSAPGAKITSRSFDRDRRYPITNAYRKTIDKA